MQAVNRRDWLRLMGLAGAATAITNVPGLGRSVSDLLPYPSRPLLPGQAVRLSSNENPYGPSKMVRDAMVRGFDDACRYTFSYTREITEMIARKEGVTKDHIVLTAGSTEGLKVAGLTFGLHGGEIVSADPTFQSLMTYAEQFGATIHWVPVDKNGAHDLPAMEKRVNGNTRLVFVCNPNNPTGTLLSAAQMRDFCKSMAGRTIVFADEAYFDYITEPGYPSMVELVKEDYNVIVSRTFSKIYGLAGVRIGYLIARPDIARRLSAATMANLNMLGIFAAKAALEDQEFYRFSLQKNEEAKNYLYGLFKSMNLNYIPSHANFVFFETGQDISAFQAAMLKENVQVGRPFPPMTKWCRVSTGTMEEMQAFGAALKKVV